MNVQLNPISRRSLLALGAMAPLASAAAPGGKIPVGLEVSSVRNEFAQDPLGTVRTAAKVGYEFVEFWMPYFWWTARFAKDLRKLMDDLGIRCYSTLNDASFFTKGKLPAAIELNQILGSKLLVATDAEADNLDGWKAVAERFTWACEKLRPLGMRAGYHNHEVEYTTIEGRRPIDLIAASARDFVLQLDVGHAMQAGVDPVAFIEQYPGRFASIHLKDWVPAPEPKCFFVAFGEGRVNWKRIFQAAEKTGGVEYYIIEQGNAPPRTPIENITRQLPIFRKLHGD